MGSLGEANTSLKLMLPGVSGAPPPAFAAAAAVAVVPLLLFLPDFLDANGEMQIMLR